MGKNNLPAWLETLWNVNPTIAKKAQINYEQMINALIEIAEKLDEEEMNVNSKEFKLWKIANDTIKACDG